MSFRKVRRFRLSPVGLGTSLGPEDTKGHRYRAGILHALRHGINVIDTALSYGAGTSERAVGAALREVLLEGEIKRDEVLLVTKAGYTPFEVDPKTRRLRPFGIDDARALGLSSDDFVGNHSIARPFLRFAIERSRQNLGLATLDVFLLHNIEQQKIGRTTRAFRAGVRAAFETLEQACTDGLLASYGISTWSALRAARGAPEYLDLNEMIALARDVGGENHRFLALEAPFNAVLPEIVTERNQRAGRRHATLVELAGEHGLVVLTSSTLMGGKLAAQGTLTGGSAELRTSAQRAIAFACKSQGITTALIGMRSVRHVEQAVRAAVVAQA